MSIGTLAKTLGIQNGRRGTRVASEPEELEREEDDEQLEPKMHAKCKFGCR
jgi:hypothetical protein